MAQKEQETRKFLPRRELTEENDLLRSAKKGAAGAQAALFEQYAPLLKSAARAPYLRRTDLSDEAGSIARLAFWEAIQEYNESRGIPFAAFAASKVKYALYSAFRRARRDWDREIHPDQSEDAAAYWDAVTSKEAAGSPEEAVTLHVALEEAMRTLTERERKILRLIFFEEAPLKAIAEKLQVTRQAVSKAKKSILRKLRMQMERDDFAFGC